MKFEQISGTYLTFMAKTVCRACWSKVAAGQMAEDDPTRYVVSPCELEAFAKKHGRGTATTPQGKRLLVARTKAHYAKHHPEVVLPR